MGTVVLQYILSNRWQRLISYLTELKMFLIVVVCNFVTAILLHIIICSLGVSILCFMFIIAFIMESHSSHESVQSKFKHMQVCILSEYLHCVFC